MSITEAKNGSIVDLNALLVKIRLAERFIYDHYRSGESMISDVAWMHDPPKTDMLVWARQYPGKMTLGPSSVPSSIHLYSAREEGRWIIEFNLWFDERESYLTASLDYDEDTGIITIEDLHVM